jgi:uncharacterized delta-60 repeat protein
MVDRLRRYLLAALAASLCVAGAAVAKSGDLDPSFGEGGLVTSGPDHSVLYDLQTLPDGRILAAGVNQGAFAVARYMPDGSLDPGFGGGDGIGLAEVKPAGFYDSSYATDLALQDDGKIVAAGIGQWESNTDFVVMRFEADGTVDSSFGIDGQLSLEGYGGSGLEIQDDGKIVVAGSTDRRPNAILFYRLLPSGDLDRTFGKHGRKAVPAPFGRYATPFALTLQPNGKLVAAGEADTRDREQHVYLLRLKPSGDPDPGFGHGGVVRTKITSASFAEDLALRRDGKIVVVGDTDRGPRHRTGWFVARYHRNGRLDRSFGGGDWLVQNQFGNSSVPVAVALSRGKIFVAGVANGVSGVESAVILARYRSGGDLDRGFGHHGFVITRVGKEALANAVSATPKGPVIAGLGTVGKTHRFLLARYAND